MYEKYWYRAFALDTHGDVISGIEEEFLARSMAEAKRHAWRMASFRLAEFSQCIYMHTIDKGEIVAKGQINF